MRNVTPHSWGSDASRDAGRETRQNAQSVQDVLVLPITHHGSRITSSRVSSKGFSLIAAIFLIVVIAALGAFAVRIGAGEQQTVNLALVSARALAAANSGIEWGAYQALNAGSCTSTTTTTLNLTEAALNGFTVTVVCTPSLHSEGGSSGGVHVYVIDSTAVSGTYGTPDFVSRHVYATFTDSI